MNLYVFARVVQGLTRLAFKKGLEKENRDVIAKYSWPVFGSLTWAAVMWLFRWYPEVIHVYPLDNPPLLLSLSRLGQPTTVCVALDC
jgi:hypothetical protein